MKTVISYALFDQLEKKFDRSGHDPLDKHPYRYWLNLPSIMIVNNSLFKDSIIRLYIPKLLETNKYYKLLELFDENIENFELVKIDKQYIQTEPAIWRIMALWDNDIDFCFCRDIDSIVTRKEAQSMIYFMKSGLMIHNIRSTKQHNNEGTSIMAGLNGFNVKKTKPGLPLPESFDKYMSFYEDTTKKGVWGCDQEALLNFFIRHRTARITKQVLDTYIQPKRNTPRFGRVDKNKYYDMVSLDENVYNNISFSPETERLLSISDSTTCWAGEPINASGRTLLSLAGKTNDKHSKNIMNIIKSDKEYKKLYSIT